MLRTLVRVTVAASLLVPLAVASPPANAVNTTGCAGRLNVQLSPGLSTSIVPTPQSGSWTANGSIQACLGVSSIATSGTATGSGTYEGTAGTWAVGNFSGTLSWSGCTASLDGHWSGGSWFATTTSSCFTVTGAMSGTWEPASPQVTLNGMITEIMVQFGQAAPA